MHKILFNVEKDNVQEISNIVVTIMALIIIVREIRWDAELYVEMECVCHLIKLAVMDINSIHIVQHLVIIVVINVG